MNTPILTTRIPLSEILYPVLNHHCSGTTILYMIQLELFLLSFISALQIVFEGKKAVGVKFEHDGEVHTVRADKEVLLCAGMVGIGGGGVIYIGQDCLRTPSGEPANLIKRDEKKNLRVYEYTTYYPDPPFPKSYIQPWSTTAQSQLSYLWYNWSYFYFLLSLFADSFRG